MRASPGISDEATCVLSAVVAHAVTRKVATSSADTRRIPGRAAGRRELISDRTLLRWAMGAFTRLLTWAPAIPMTTCRSPRSRAAWETFNVARSPLCRNASPRHMVLRPPFPVLGSSPPRVALSTSSSRVRQSCQKAFESATPGNLKSGRARLSNWIGCDLRSFNETQGSNVEANVRIE